MARLCTGPKWYPSRKSYFVEINGKSYNLGPDRATAIREFARLVLRAPKVTSDPTVAEIVKAYLGHKLLEWKPNSIKIRTRALGAFVKRYGKTHVSELIPYHATEVRRDRIFLTSLKSCFNWAVAQGLIPENPFLHIPQPKPGKRGDSCLITPEQHQLMLTAASEALQNVLNALWHTGNRPGYIITVEAREVLRDRWVCGPMPGRKLAKATIYLNEFMQELSARLAALNPTGPIFRNETGTPWTRNYLQEAVAQARSRAGLPHIVPYGYRHSFARRALDRGVGIADLAILMNTSVRMIEATYGHPATLADRLKKSLEQVG